MRVLTPETTSSMMRDRGSMRKAASALKGPEEIQVKTIFSTALGASGGSFKNSRKIATVTRKLRPTAREPMVPTTPFGRLLPNRPLTKKPMKGNRGISQT